MSKWTPIEVGSGKSKDSAQDSEDSLNNDEMLDLEEDNQNNQDEDETDTTDDDNVDLADDVLDEESTDEDADSAEEKEEEVKKPSRAEARIRELVADKKAAEDRAREAEARAEAMQARAVANEKQSIDSDIVSTKATLERVKQNLKIAVEAGDTDALIKEQQALSENTVRLMALESSKNNFEAEQKKAPVKKEQRNDGGNSQVPQEALNWAEKNDGWFNKNSALTGAALGINQELLQAGYNPESPAFYAELDKRLAPFKPKDANSPKSKQEALKPKSTQVVGSSSKTVPPKSVKVTPQDADRARRLGIDPKRYLKQKAEYERNSQNSVSTFKPIFINKDRK